ncbi:hypothetical protein FPV67DRAFT_293801 [Lyophyllum atratum]|nr:hypothetical protein FPV67DRAFT_293801 [Lyophyllum atratum]
MLVPELAAQGLCLVLSALDAALPSRRGGKFSGGRSRTRISRVEAVLLLYKTAFSDMNREVRHITIVVRKSDNSRIQQKLKRRDRVRNGIRGGHVDRSDFPTALNGERDGGTRAKRFCFGLPSFLPHSLHLDRFPRLYLRRRAIPASIIAINAPLAGGIIPPLRSCRTIKVCQILEYITPGLDL